MGGVASPVGEDSHVVDKVLIVRVSRDGGCIATDNQKSEAAGIPGAEKSDWSAAIATNAQRKSPFGGRVFGLLQKGEKPLIAHAAEIIQRQ